MRFEIRSPSLVVFHDDKPHQHATMFGPDGVNFLFRGDLSSFNDRKHEYAWVFEGIISDGDRVVFASSDHDPVIGIVDGLDVTHEVDHDAGHDGGKPTRMLVLPVAELLAPPFQESAPRPIPLLKADIK